MIKNICKHKITAMFHYLYGDKVFHESVCLLCGELITVTSEDRSKRSLNYGEISTNAMEVINAIESLDE